MQNTSDNSAAENNQQKVPIDVRSIRLDERGRPLFQTMGECREYMAAMIRTGFLPNHLDEPAKAVLAMQTCENAGLPWQQWIGKTYLIGGKIAVYVEFLRAAAEQSGKCEYVRVRLLDENGEPKSAKNAKGFKVFAAECRVKEKGVDEVQEVIYTLEDVEAAKFTNNNYKLHPADMLMWRAMGRALKIAFPMICGGFLTQGIDDMTPVVGEDGRTLRTDDGAAVYHKRDKAMQAAERRARQIAGNDAPGQAP